MVKYISGLTDSTKQTIRDHYGVYKIKRCDCADESLELWIFNPDSIQGGIEEIKGHASSDPDLEGTDFQYMFTQAPSGVSVNGPTQQLAGMIQPGNAEVTIAIVDSGLDLDYSGFPEQFLYNSQIHDAPCQVGEMQEISGWDFVDQDNIPQDMHGHGTVVTDIIVRELIAHDVNFDILPIRSFNELGEGTTFDITCGVVQALLKEDVDIVNMSFGWYLNESTILSQFIEQASDEVLVIASAGNQGVNNDLYPHFPSGYDYANVLAIAGMNDSLLELDTLSNYGYSSVDLAASFRNIPFLYQTDTIHHSGTSFSAAYATAKAAELFVSGETPAYQVSWLVSQAVHKDALNWKLKHPKMIVP